MQELSRICLIHYHEIGLKGHNRADFEHKLMRNLKSSLNAFKIQSVKKISGRVCITMQESCNFDDLISLIEIAKLIPGVARVSCGLKCEREMQAINEAALICLNEIGDFQTFKVSARRSHTDFPIDSMQLNQLVGAYLCDNFSDKTVKMKNPDVTVGVEVVQGSAYVYAKSIPAIGGLPVGSSGRLVCLLSSGFDSPVALWKMARRGAACIGVHFSGRPQSSPVSEYLVKDIAEVLEKSGCIAKLYVVAIGDYQREISLKVAPKLRVIMYRRFMFEIAQKIAEIENAKGLVTGESLGQVASQTIDNIFATNEVVYMPILRPLIGTDKLEIINDSKRLGTHDISASDAPDCCTLFMPKTPETHAKMSEVLENSAAIDSASWISEAIENADVFTYRCSGYSSKKHQNL